MFLNRQLEDVSLLMSRIEEDVIRSKLDVYKSEIEELKRSIIQLNKRKNPTEYDLQQKKLAELRSLHDKEARTLTRYMRKAVAIFKSLIDIITPGRMPAVLKENYHIEQFSRIPYIDEDFLAQIEKVKLRYQLLDKDYFFDKYDQLYEEMRDKCHQSYEEDLDTHTTSSIIRKSNIMMAVFDAPMFMVFYSQTSAKSSLGKLPGDMTYEALQEEMRNN